jgi:hypothetical protein
MFDLERHYAGRFTVRQSDHTKVFAKRIDVDPMANAAIRLYLGCLRCTYRLLAPVKPNIGAISKHAPFEVVGLVHRAAIRLRRVKKAHGGEPTRHRLRWGCWGSLLLTPTYAG